MKRIGLIVNPFAGIGGRVGLKGSDGADTVCHAIELGAVSEALQRATSSLLPLSAIRDTLEVFTYPLEMGETSARDAGFTPKVIGAIRSGATTADDTQRAARELCALDVDLLLFAGGDGTARDICKAIPAAQVPCLGIPAGVKIHSGVYATNPRHAGELAMLYLEDKARLREAEVLDLDENAYRAGRVSTHLYGYLNVPHRPLLMQNQKVPSPASEVRQAESIAVAVIEEMQRGILYILGPGTTTRALAQKLGVAKTLVGVDVIRNGRLIAQDVTQAQLLALIETTPAKIIVTPIGGQGFLFGRGNQQIGPEVIRKVGRENIIVISTSDKLNALRLQPFLVDTGDDEVDALLAGHFTVITGYREQTVYRVVS
ncbi:MAG: ATP-NAD kinase family protein [Anaerolineales bacterium]|nr:ATP-NAD kinase family protein [Anaerolineales bacterium]